MQDVFTRDGVWYANCKVLDPDTGGFLLVKKSTRIKVSGPGSRERALIVRSSIERSLALGRDRKNGPTIAQAFDARARALIVSGAPKTTRKRSTYSAARVFNGLGPDTEIQALTTEQLTVYASERVAEGASSDTVRRELADLRAACAAKGVLLCPGPKLPKPRAVERWLDAGECLKLLAAAPPKRARVIELVLQTMLRKGEVWHLVRIGPGLGLVRETEQTEAEGALKTGARTIPLTPRAEEILAEGPLEPWVNQGRDLKAFADRAGLGRVTWNDLRATPATLLMLAGVDRSKIARVLGHKSTRMVDRRYARIASIEVSAADLSALGGIRVQNSSPLRSPEHTPAAENVVVPEPDRS